MLIVADIGNTRVKWGRCGSSGIDSHVSLPSDDPAAWLAQANAWSLTDEAWAVASVQPATRERFVAWLRERGRPVRVIEKPADVRVPIAVDHPEWVGIDRLIDAVAANAFRPPDRAAIIVDAGSAVTVDLVDASGVFRGGAIVPGLRLMCRALNDHTALLPLVEITERIPPPATSTLAAIKTGVFHAVVGGIERLISDMHQPDAVVFLTGGDAELLHPHLRRESKLWPEMTLEGLREAATESRRIAMSAP